MVEEPVVGVDAVPGGVHVGQVGAHFRIDGERLTEAGLGVSVYSQLKCPDGHR
ncbi:hypothetical protein EV648_118127 [Kribbella sp. VKM Ac-2568]|nr:hypothetical protein EV648_118127 [Kribbella sp. VKM Ac-2568]